METGKRICRRSPHWRSTLCFSWDSQRTPVDQHQQRTSVDDTMRRWEIFYFMHNLWWFLSKVTWLKLCLIPKHTGLLLSLWWLAFDVNRHRNDEITHWNIWHEYTYEISNYDSLRCSKLRSNYLRKRLLRYINSQLALIYSFQVNKMTRITSRIPLLVDSVSSVNSLLYYMCVFIIM
jgi:hypothetical protein